jgi:GNAT superfamily N-acetyltransferase
LPDLLVPLYGLPPVEVPEGYWVGNPLAHQSPLVLDFVEEYFGRSWRAEAAAAFARTPPGLKLAVSESTGDIHGFCCWDCTARGFLGPVGVAESARGRGVGRTIVLSVLHSMRDAGYGYAIVGGAGPVEFFQSICDARVIEGSDPGIYGNPL